MKFNFYKFIFIGLVVTSVISCSKGLLQDSWDVANSDRDVAVPLIDSKFSSSELILSISKPNNDKNDTSVVEYGPNRELALLYTNNGLPKIDVDSAVQLPLVPFNVTSNTTDLSLAAFLIDQIQFKSGFVRYDFTSPVNEDIVVTMELTTTRHSNTQLPLIVQYNLPYAGTNRFVGDIDISQYTTRPSQGGFAFKYTAKKVSDNSNVTLTNFRISFRDLKFKYAEGAVPTTQYLPLDSIDINVFKTIDAGYLYVENPQLILNIESNVGLPVNIRLDTLYVQTKNTRGLVPVIVNNSSRNTVLNYPLMSEIGKVKTTQIIIDASNSNAADVFKLLVTKVYYKLTAVTGFDRGHLTDSSFIRFNAQIRIPFKGWGNQLTVRDTFKFDSEKLKDFRYLDFKSVTENRIPGRLYAQVYFLNSASQPIDSLFNPNEALFEPAPYDAKGHTTGATNNTKYTSFDAVRTQRIIAEAKKIALRAVVTTDKQPNQIMELLERDYFRFKLGLKAGIK